MSTVAPNELDRWERSKPTKQARRKQIIGAGAGLATMGCLRIPHDIGADLGGCPLTVLKVAAAKKHAIAARYQSFPFHGPFRAVQSAECVLNEVAVGTVVHQV